MKTVILAILVLGLAACSTSPEQISWGYEDSQGPTHWAELSETFALCGSGKNQSPINLTNTLSADLASLLFTYNAVATSIEKNGPILQINFAGRSQISLGGRNFELQRLLFHSPSEHTIDGRTYPLEAQFIHGDQNGNPAIVSVLFEEGDENPVISQLWANLPELAGEKTPLTGFGNNYIQLLPNDRNYFQYNGSITTPPCTEGVFWFILKQTPTVSKAQVEQLFQLMQQANNRPMQAVNARMVLE